MTVAKVAFEGEMVWTRLSTNSRCASKAEFVVVRMVVGSRCEKVGGGVGGCLEPDLGGMMAMPSETRKGIAGAIVCCFEEWKFVEGGGLLNTWTGGGLLGAGWVANEMTEGENMARKI